MARFAGAVLFSCVFRVAALFFSFVACLLHSLLLFLPNSFDPHGMCGFLYCLGPNPRANIRMANGPRACLGKRDSCFAVGFGNSNADGSQDLSPVTADIAGPPA